MFQDVNNFLPFERHLCSRLKMNRGRMSWVWNKKKKRNKTQRAIDETVDGRGHETILTHRLGNRRNIFESRYSPAEEPQWRRVKSISITYSAPIHNEKLSHDTLHVEWVYDHTVNLLKSDWWSDDWTWKHVSLLKHDKRLRQEGETCRFSSNAVQQLFNSLHGKPTHGALAPPCVQTPK